METARRAALRIREDYGWRGHSPTWEQLLRLCAAAGAHVEMDADLRGRVREVYAAGTIALRAGLTRVWRRWLLGHGLAHHILHPGTNHLYLAGRDERFWIDRNERDAEVFVGFLLFGPLDRPIEGVLDVMSLAIWADAPLASTRRWVTLVGHEPSPVVSLDRMDIDYAALLDEPVKAVHRVRPWSPFLAALFTGLTMLRADFDGDGVVQLVRWATSAARLLA